MARVELELDDKGDIVGDVPEAIKAIHARIENAAHGQGYGKGAAKAAEEAKAQIAAAVAAEKAKLEAMAPLERERYQRESEENKTLKQQMLESNREWDRQSKAREEAHATQLLERSEALKKRSARIIEMTKEQLIAEARAAGARDESLNELRVILHAFVGYTDDMDPFIRNEDGTQKTVQGKPQSMSAFVKEYLDGHAHHKRPAGGQGGSARGGASMQGHGAGSLTVEAARARLQSDPHSTDAINSLFEANRRKSA